MAPILGPFVVRCVAIAIAWKYPVGALYKQISAHYYLFLEARELSTLARITFHCAVLAWTLKSNFSRGKILFLKNEEKIRAYKKMLIRVKRISRISRLEFEMRKTFYTLSEI